VSAWSHALVVVVVGLVVACGRGSQAPASQGSATPTSDLPPVTQDAKPEAVQDPRQESSPVTAAVLANANDSLEYQVGNPDFEGRTVVRVAGDGSAEASFERGGKTQRYQGRVPAAKLQALRDSLTSHPIDRYKPAKRKPVPDEAALEFTLVTGGTRAHAGFLSTDRHTIDALGDLVDLIQDIASKISGGKIKY